MLIPSFKSALPAAHVGTSEGSYTLPVPGRRAFPLGGELRSAEFFAGIGLVRRALEPLGIGVEWANDIEPTKLKTYSANYGSDDFILEDICVIRGSDIPAGLDLATSSFPCKDLSLAGGREGLAGVQSRMFWEFSRVLSEMNPQDRPRSVLLENVAGFATSRDGKDVRAALVELNQLGYTCDVFTVDARHFVPQSRSRMFIIGTSERVSCVGFSRGIPPKSDTRPKWIIKVHQDNQDLSLHHMELPSLPPGPRDLGGIVEAMPLTDKRWWSSGQVKAFIDSLSRTQMERFITLRDATDISWRTAYRRTRAGKPTWEVRKDAIAGCLRTTGGGSSRQALVRLGQGTANVRWMTAAEYARLMGAGDIMFSDVTENQALYGFGDAVVVDVIRWIGEKYLLPVLAGASPG